MGGGGGAVTARHHVRSEAPARGTVVNVELGEAGMSGTGTRPGHAGSSAAPFGMPFSLKTTGLQSQPTAVFSMTSR